MTPDQRRIAVLERRVKLLRTDLVGGLVLGASVFPAWLARIDVFSNNPVLALQAGILIALIFVIVANGIREFRANRREATLREQDHLESLPTPNARK